tara:strand:- start:10102 stop:10386 length:285 start_codon:yes stop_codon:yes gene_type:complete
MDKIIKTLNEILNCLYRQKQVLTFEEACRYCGTSASSMYKHTSANKIPFYKPEGKLIYFKREDLDAWMLRNRNASIEELEQIASRHSISKRNNY